MKRSRISFGSETFISVWFSRITVYPCYVTSKGVPCCATNTLSFKLYFSHFYRAKNCHFCFEVVNRNCEKRLGYSNTNTKRNVDLKVFVEYGGRLESYDLVPYYSTIEPQNVY